MQELKNVSQRRFICDTKLINFLFLKKKTEAHFVRENIKKAKDYVTSFKTFSLFRDGSAFWLPIFSAWTKSWKVSIIAGSSSFLTSSIINIYLKLHWIIHVTQVCNIKKIEQYIQGLKKWTRSKFECSYKTKDIYFACLFQTALIKWFQGL